MSAEPQHPRLATPALTREQIAEVRRLVREETEAERRTLEAVKRGLLQIAAMLAPKRKG